MKKIVLLSLLLLTGLMAQTTNQDSINALINRDIADVLVVYGTASMIAGALSPTYDNFNNQIVTSLVKVAIVIVAKQYANEKKPKRIYTLLLQVGLTSMLVRDIRILRDF